MHEFKNVYIQCIKAMHKKIDRGYQKPCKIDLTSIFHKRDFRKKSRHIATFIGSFEGVQKYYVAYESSSSSACTTKKRYDKNDTLVLIHQDYIKTFDIGY